MEIYPDTPKQGDLTKVTPVWNTLKSNFGNGAEQRRSKWLFAKYNIDFRHPQLSVANAMLIWEFYMARKGSKEAFYYFDKFSFNHVGLYVCTTDGVNDTFDLPGKSTSDRAIYGNGIEEATGFSILIGGGDGDSDRIEFTSVPSSGIIYTIDFRGYLRIKCRFEQDNLSRENFPSNLMRYGIRLKGL